MQKNHFAELPDSVFEEVRTIMKRVLDTDAETFHHCVRVSRGSRLLAQAAGLDEYQQKVAEYAGLFHDIGKVYVPTTIINKPGKLTDEEYEIMKSHPMKSVHMIESLCQHQFFKDLVPGIMHHHERIDGRGYPFKVAGDEIPYISKVILVADTWDAMSMDRAYRKGLPADVVEQELRDCSGTQFDPQLVTIFLQARRFWARHAEAIEQEMLQTLTKAA